MSPMLVDMVAVGLAASAERVVATASIYNVLRTVGYVEGFAKEGWRFSTYHI